jgi:hypothetical protein
MKSWSDWFNTQPKHHQHKEFTGKVTRRDDG